MFPRRFKADVLLAFGLDHFQDMIRFQHMAAVVETGENKVEENKFEYILFCSMLHRKQIKKLLNFVQSLILKYANF